MLPAVNTLGVVAMATVLARTTAVPYLLILYARDDDFRDNHYVNVASKLYRNVMCKKSTNLNRAPTLAGVYGTQYEICHAPGITHRHLMVSTLIGCG